MNAYQLPLHNEKLLQSELAQLFSDAGFSYQREQRLSAGNVIDFLFDDVGLEVKIKGSKTAIFRQCKRYCESGKISALVLVTSVAIGFPEDINGVPVTVINLAKAWI